MDPVKMDSIPEGMNDRELIEHLVGQYLLDHPDFTMPSATQHTLILAMTLEMSPWMTKQLGGLIPYWWTLLGAAQLWFDPKDDEYEFRAFRAMMTTEGVRAHQSGSKYGHDFGQMNREFSAWAKQARN